MFELSEAVMFELSEVVVTSNSDKKDIFVWDKANSSSEKNSKFYKLAIKETSYISLPRFSL